MEMLNYISSIAQGDYLVQKPKLGSGYALVST
jgi:hypothetical protein